MVILCNYTIKKGVYMAFYQDITHEQIEKLAKLISKSMKINIEDAKNIIYDEYELAENLFNSCKKIKDVAKKFVNQINEVYQIA